MRVGRASGRQPADCVRALCVAQMKLVQIGDQAIDVDLNEINSNLGTSTKVLQHSTLFRITPPPAASPYGITCEEAEQR